MALQQEIFTQSITASSFVIQQGALSITIKNTGAGSVFFQGDGTSGGVASNLVSLDVGQSVTFPQSPSPYPSITVDATTSKAQIIAVY